MLSDTHTPNALVSEYIELRKQRRILTLNLIGSISLSNEQFAKFFPKT